MYDVEDIFNAEFERPEEEDDASLGVYGEDVEADAVMPDDVEAELTAEDYWADTLMRMGDLSRLPCLRIVEEISIEEARRRYPAHPGLEDHLL